MIERRVFLKSAVAAAAAIPFQAFLARAAEPTHKGGLRRGQTAGYGPLFETADQTTGLPLLMLPEGFKYLSFGWRGDMMSNGQPTPSAHDGMATFDVGNGRTRLVRNHELDGLRTPVHRRQIRSGHRRRHDHAGIRHAQGRTDRVVAQSERHGAQLRRRTDALGKLADL